MTARIPAAVLFTILVPVARPDDGDEKRETTFVTPGQNSVGAGLDARQEQGEAPESTKAGAAESTKTKSLFRSWMDMAELVQTEQPDCLSPLATTSGRLKQEFRYDV